MIALTQIFHKLFPEREIAVSLVQTALEEIHEQNPAEATEFLDDLPRMDDPSEGETETV